MLQGGKRMAAKERKKKASRSAARAVKPCPFIEKANAFISVKSEIKKNCGNKGQNGQQYFEKHSFSAFHGKPHRNKKNKQKQY